MKFRSSLFTKVAMLLCFAVQIVWAAEPSFEIADIAWKLGANHPELRKGGCLTVKNGKIISVFGMRYPWGEMATMYIYDPVTGMWKQGPDGPLGQTYVEGTECSDVFYAIGGRSGSKGGVHRLCYALAENQGTYSWTQIASLNQARAFAPSAAVGKKVFVFGGAATTTGPTLSSVEMLDTSRPGASWQTISNLPAGTRGWVTAAAVKDKIYLIGGAQVQTQTQRTNDLWVFDPSNDEWQKRKSLPYRVSGMDSCVYKDRYIIVLGGAAMAEDFSEEMNTAWHSDPLYASYYCPFVIVYDTTTDTWHRMPSRLLRPTNDIRVVLLGDKIYAMGGENIERDTSNTTAWLRIGEIKLQDKTASTKP
jgi:N-acetylneuraminic acid mutarotase